VPRFNTTFWYWTDSQAFSYACTALKVAHNVPESKKHKTDIHMCVETETKSTPPDLLIGIRTQLLEQAIKLFFQLLVLWISDERHRFDCPRIDISGAMEQNDG
jgi:hypothetical protein